MARCKVLHYTPQAASSTSRSLSAKEHGFTSDHYNRRYREVDKKRRCRGLYCSMQKISQSDFACSQLNDDTAYQPVGSLMQCKNLLRWFRREST